MAIKKFYLNDDFAIFDRFFGFASPTFSYLKGELYDPETHELVPKKSYLEKEIKEKEDTVATLKKEIEELKKRL